MKTKEELEEKEIIRRLYDAVIDYVEFKGGKLAIIGGIQIMQLPTDRKFYFTVGIRCIGKKPEYVEQNGERL